MTDLIERLRSAQGWSGPAAALRVEAASALEAQQKRIAELEYGLREAIELAEEWGDVLPGNTYMVCVLAPLKALAGKGDDHG